MDEKLLKAKEILNKSFLLNAQSRNEALQRGENFMTTEDIDFLMSFEIIHCRVPTFGQLNRTTKVDNDYLIVLLEDAKKENSWVDFYETIFSEENKKMLKENNFIKISFKNPFNKDIIFFSEELYVKYLILQFQELISGLGSALG